MMDEYVPGTTRILDDFGEASHGDNIALVPQPSEDPEDPLNWSQKRKYINLAVLVAYTALLSLGGTILYAIYVPLTEETGLTLDQLNIGVGFQYLLIGLGTLTFQPAALAFGKKPIYIASCLGFALINIWTAFIQTNAQWIGRCMLLGFFIAPSFSLVEVSIADLFFYHERAWPMGMYVCVIYSGACLGPVLSGFIYDGIGWRGCIWVATGMGILCMLLFVLFFEETNFDREAVVAEILLEASGTAKDDEDQKEPVDAPETRVVHIGQRLQTPWPGLTPFKFVKPSPYAKGIMWRGFVEPLMLIRSPLVVWCGFMYGLYQTYYNLLAAITSGVLFLPPYNFSPSATGLTFISPLLATIPGALVAGWLIDRWTLSQARKNGGIAEAEHKLKLFVIPTILCPIGLLMMGLGPYYGAHWIVFVIGEWVLNVASPLATLLALTYAFDTYHAIEPNDPTGARRAVQSSAPYVLLIMVIGMVVTFAFNYAITPWAFMWGLRNFAISSACISVALNLTVLPILKWGKTLRRNGAGFYQRVINL